MQVRRDMQTPRLCLSADGARGEGTPARRPQGTVAQCPPGPYPVDSAPAHFPFLPGAQRALQRALLARPGVSLPASPLLWGGSQVGHKPRALAGPQPVSPSLGRLLSGQPPGPHSVPGKLKSLGSGECS